MMFFLSHKQEEGASLYLVIVVMASMLGMVFGLGGVLIDEIRLVRGLGDSVLAFYAAEAGIEKTLYDDKVSGPPPGASILATCTGPGTCTGSLPNGSSYDVVVDAPGSGNCPGSAIVYCIRSIGTFKNTERAIFIER